MSTTKTAATKEPAKAKSISLWATEIKEEHAKVLACTRDALEHARKCGSLLENYMSSVHHGEKEAAYKKLGLEEKTATNYRRIAKNWKQIKDAGAETVTAALAAMAKPKEGGKGKGKDKGKGKESEVEIKTPTTAVETITYLTTQTSVLHDVLHDPEAIKSVTTYTPEQRLKVAGELGRLIANAQRMLEMVDPSSVAGFASRPPMSAHDRAAAAAAIPAA